MSDSESDEKDQQQKLLELEEKRVLFSLILD